MFKLRSCHGRSQPHTALTPVGSQPLITLLCWALECPSPYTTRLQRQAEEKALVDSPPLSKRQELGPQGKHLCQGQEARPRLGKRGAGGGCGPTPGSWLGLLPPSLPQALQGAAWWGKGGGRQGEAGGLLELSRGNFVGKGDKEEHQKES